MTAEPEPEPEPEPEIGEGQGTHSLKKRPLNSAHALNAAVKLSMQGGLPDAVITINLSEKIYKTQATKDCL